MDVDGDGGGDCMRIKCLSHLNNINSAIRFIEMCFSFLPFFSPFTIPKSRTKNGKEFFFLALNVSKIAPFVLKTIPIVVIFRSI